MSSAGREDGGEVTVGVLPEDDKPQERKHLPQEPEELSVSSLSQSLLFPKFFREGTT